MNKNTFRLISLTLALAASSTSLAAENGTAHQFPNGTWGCIDRWSHPIPPGANGRWEGKLQEGAPRKPASAVATNPDIRDGNGQIGATATVITGGPGRTRAVASTKPQTAPATWGATHKSAASYPLHQDAGSGETLPLFDAKGTQFEASGKGITEKGIK